MTAPIADGVMAATYKLVQQAMTGQWQDVPKTIEERRLMLDKLSAAATPQDQQWLGALKQAMAESDAVVAKMADAPTLTLPRTTGEGTDAAPTLTLPRATGEGTDAAPTLILPRATGEGTGAAGPADTVANMIDMIRGSR